MSFRIGAVSADYGETFLLEGYGQSLRVSNHSPGELSPECLMLSKSDGQCRQFVLIARLQEARKCRVRYLLCYVRLVGEYQSPYRTSHRLMCPDSDYMSTFVKWLLKAPK